MAAPAERVICVSLSISNKNNLDGEVKVLSKRLLKVSCEDTFQQILHRVGQQLNEEHKVGDDDGETDSDRPGLAPHTRGRVTPV